MNKSELIDKSLTNEITNIDQKVRYAQVQLLYKQTRTGLIGSLIVSLTASVVFWQVVPQWILTLWTSLVVLITLIRGSIVFAFEKRASISSNIGRWANLHVIGIVASGILWAIPFIFLWPIEHHEFQLVWVILILPMSAAAVATYYTWSPSYIIFLVLTALPLSLRFFIEGGELFYILGILTIFFIGVLLRAGKVMHAASIRSFEFGIRNETLNVELKEGISLREQLNEQLQQEIAERKLAENEIRKLSKVFLDGTNPTFIEDLNGHILEMNHEAVNFYGFSREELVGKSIKILAPDEQHEKIDEWIQLCLRGKLVRDVESIQRKKDGSKIPVLMTLSLLSDEENNPFAIASMASDITELKNIEKELTKSNAVAESANAAKDKFFKIISHDLKSPFNSIIGFSNLLSEEYDSFDDLKKKDYIQRINSSSLYTYNLLENLLTWATAQTDEISINKEELDLKKLVESSITNALLNAQAKNISIINNIPPELILSIDKNTAFTFIRNIVNNAIKFTHNGGHITIDSHANKDSISIHIADTGVGISPQVIEHLFQVGEDISTPGTNNEKGTGLGLILCKEFIERNGGSITVKSVVNKGSEFIIVLPR